MLYRVDDEPVLLLCGTVPAYRDLPSAIRATTSVSSIANLHELGYDAADVDRPDDSDFTWKTEQALEQLQHDKGFDATGALAIDDAVFLPESVRIAKVTGAARRIRSPGAQVAAAPHPTRSRCRWTSRRRSRAR